MPEKAMWFLVVIATAIASVDPGIVVMPAADDGVVVDIVAEMMAEAVKLAVGMKGSTAPESVSKGPGWLVGGHLLDQRVVSAALEKPQSRTQTGR